MFPAHLLLLTPPSCVAITILGALCRCGIKIPFPTSLLDYNFFVRNAKIIFVISMGFMLIIRALFVALGIIIYAKLSLANKTEKEIVQEKFVAVARQYYDGIDNFRLCYIGSEDLPRSKGDEKLCNMLNKKNMAEAKNFVREIAEIVKTINYDLLNEEEQIVYKIIEAECKNRIGFLSQEIPLYLPIWAQDNSPHLYALAMVYKLNLENEASRKRYLEGLRFTRSFIEDAIKQMRIGIVKGITLQRYVLDKTIETTYLAIDEKSGMLKVAEERTKGDKKAQNEIRATRKAQEKLIKFLTKEYYQHASKNTGLWQFKGGEEYYNFLLRTVAETNLSAEEVYEMGKEEVNKIRAKFEELKVQSGFKGSTIEFVKKINKDSMVFKTNENILSYFEGLKKITDQNAKKLFNIVPKKIPLAIKMLESGRSMGMYYRRSGNGNPGTFYVSCNNPREFIANASVFVHEGIGHYYQREVMNENANLSPIRASAFFSTSSEGWALYTERLGYELDVYNSIEEQVSYLQNDMLRAVRLVADTGLHAKKWDMNMIKDFMRENLLPEEEIDSEMIRYFTEPTQVLTYKIGQFSILSALEKCKMSDNFDIKQFHDKILLTGVVPMDTLIERIGC